MGKKWFFLLVIVTIVHSGVNACAMSAVIARNGTCLSDFPKIGSSLSFGAYNDPYDYIAYTMSSSNVNTMNDGYGIISYPQNQFFIASNNRWYKYLKNLSDRNKVYYTGNYFNILNPPDVFDEALSECMGGNSNAAIIMCHARNSTANPFAPGNHPFRMELNGRTYSLMHNGFMSSASRLFMINETTQLFPNWFSTHQPNYSSFSNSAYPAYWIDSEVMFHFLMSHVVANDNNVFIGMKLALTKLGSFLKLPSNVANFILCDGQRLYAFRSSPLNGANSGYKLSYRYISDGFYGIKSGNAGSLDTQLKQFELVIFSRDKKPACYQDFLRNIPGLGDHYNNTLIKRPEKVNETIISADQSEINVSFILDKPTFIRLRIYNQKGQFVRELTSGRLQEGFHRMAWDGSDSKGKVVSRGVYFIDMQADLKRHVSKVLLLGR